MALTRIQVSAHVSRHRGGRDLAGLLLVAAPVVLVVLAWWAGLR